ncbi:MAG: aminoglycoside phosphotransferase family protein [Rhodospirillaceae bacterium]
MTKYDPEILAFLRRGGLAGTDETPPMTPLAGGVSSDIWRVDLAGGPVCVKRAFAKLKVEQDWFAPVERNAFEVAWMETASGILPGIAPGILAHDPGPGLFAMAFLDPGDHPVWKAELRAGRADPMFAEKLGRGLAQIHGATRDDPDIARRFKTDETFRSIRLEPYLIATGRRHPDLAAMLQGLAETTAENRHCLVHGDVSPKNILCGPDGPVIIDAECAWYGDPAFDLAFCLNHLLLKCLWTPTAAPRFIDCCDAMVSGYGPVAEVERRTAALLPALMLARVDGKSPVEYLTEESDRDRVRRAAVPLIKNSPAALGNVRDAWKKEIGV